MSKALRLTSVLLVLDLHLKQSTFNLNAQKGRGDMNRLVRLLRRWSVYQRRTRGRGSIWLICCSGATGWEQQLDEWGEEEANQRRIYKVTWVKASHILRGHIFSSLMWFTGLTSSMEAFERDRQSKWEQTRRAFCGFLSFTHSNDVRSQCYASCTCTNVVLLTGLMCWSPVSSLQRSIIGPLFHNQML